MLPLGHNSGSVARMTGRVARVDWNLSLGDRLPTNRHAFPKAPFASAPARRGGGDIGKVVRLFQAIGRHNAGNREVSELESIELRQINLDQLVAAIDRTVLNAERWLHEQ